MVHKVYTYNVDVHDYMRTYRVFFPCLNRKCPSNVSLSIGHMPSLGRRQQE